ncbi:iron uptake transporter permease EfeU [Arthrobacter sp. NEB 688]|uniref:iron uptake transporter permease EfeU n=1 Tax=Arthrobacter sp. NEB 688 TaxID=904039 RepID=UPI0015673665|nr:iron uptake transporter permease EfeU [Arthrobacter sp. NEB 688]QKE83030.1 iron transporter [Arthrobacter sp. NEB 688]
MVVSTALIGLREGLEAALVVVVLLAFLVRTDRRWALPWVWAGVAAAVVVSAALGALLTLGTRELPEATGEAVGGAASIAAVGLVTAMVFWMRSAARGMAGELRGRLDRALSLGPLAVALVGFLGVGREGLETAVFAYATVQGAGDGDTAPLLGWALGLLGAALLGVLVYRGALRIDLARFFRWTGVALVLVAAGILAYGLHELQEAGVLPGEDLPAFDVSGAVDPGAWYAVLLRGVLNVTPAMTVLQVAAWVGYVGVVLPLFLRPARPAAGGSRLGAERTAVRA